jgi:hypothetical protein
LTAQGHGVLRVHQRGEGENHLCSLSDVSDYVIPEPEPKEIDEKLSIELRHLADNAVLKGQPSGKERCDNCRYYLEPYRELSYCWHPKLRILVGADWWCQWWEANPEDAQ